jgi:hypothetical protein
MELDRSPIRLPRLSDDESTSLPAPLVTARSALLKVATDAANRATALAADPRWADAEKQKQLTALCDATLAELAPMAEVVASVEALASEHEAAALRTAIGKFDPARLLAIQQSLSSRSREQRLSAVMRARAGDAETCAAIISAPREFSILDDIDERVIDGLRDRLVDKGLRTTFAATRFACMRFRVGWQNSIDVLRNLTKTPPQIPERVARPA